MMSAVRALVASTLPVTPAALAAAEAGRTARDDFSGLRLSKLLYSDTEQRQQMRTLLNAAAATGGRLRVAYLKKDGTLRYMLAVPIYEADPTRRYYTVEDVELTEQQGEPVYRRVNLDAIVSASVDFSAG